MGGSSNDGEGAKRGETERVELLSEMSDGAPSSDPALEISEDEGEGKDISDGRRNCEYEEVMLSELSRISGVRMIEGRCAVSSHSLFRNEFPLRTTDLRRLFMLPFHQFLTALSLRP